MSEPVVEFSLSCDSRVWKHIEFVRQFNNNVDVEDVIEIFLHSAAITQVLSSKIQLPMCNNKLVALAKLYMVAVKSDNFDLMFRCLENELSGCLLLTGCAFMKYKAHAALEVLTDKVENNETNEENLIRTSRYIMIMKKISDTLPDE